EGHRHRQAHQASSSRASPCVQPHHVRHAAARQQASGTRRCGATDCCGCVPSRAVSSTRKASMNGGYQAHVDEAEPMTPRDGGDDAYVTNYGFMQDGLLGTPPDTNDPDEPGARYDSEINLDMLSYASSTILHAAAHDDTIQIADFTTGGSGHHHHQYAMLDAGERSGLSTPKTPDTNSGERNGTAAFVSASDGALTKELSPRAKMARSHTYVSQKSISGEVVREMAKTAVSVRATSIGDITFENPRESNLRDSIRRVQAYSRRDAPLAFEISAKVFFKNKPCDIRMDRDVISWYKGARLVGTLDTDDVVGAEAPLQKAGCFRIHYFAKGKGKGAKALRRKHRFVDFSCESHIAVVWIRTIQELVRWQARAPPIADKRRIKVVVNPHSGKRRARKIWFEQVKQFFDLGNFDYEVEETTYGGHAIDMGKNYSADDDFEALVFIGGDGTLCEFMNGLLSRPDHEWREIVATTPISLISAGTQNAFGIGAGIPTPEASVYCILKRKMRPLDVITAMAEHENKVQYSYCGLGWGVAGDVAAESERYRWLGTSRYTFLKLKRGLFKPKRHVGLVRYVPADPQPKLQLYDDIRDQGAIDQFEVEEGSVYDHDRTSGLRKSWGGFAGAIRSPASKRRYAEALWREERGQFIVVGALNLAPDAAYAHPSDGNLDMIITRKGGLFRSIQLGILYLFGKELKSPLLSYVKVKAVEITADDPTDCMNIDGEVLSGPGPWRMEVIPSLFKALSEK
ncbi:TPA: hypothetical protein N0F65_009526, partial [Lagenidium giganteum]